MSKKIKTLAAIVTALAILVTGTFAYQKILIKTNEFIGSPEDVTLHDDFDPDTGGKDVYVENTGTKPLLIKVKLDEAMSLVDNTWRPTVKEWIRHKCGVGETFYSDCDNENAANKKFHDYFTWEMGGSKWYMPAAGSSKVVQDTTVYDENSGGAKLTPEGVFMTITEYNALSDDEKKAYIGWVMDCADGYFYWSQLLEKDEVTGLLLTQVNISDELNNKEYYYAINVTVVAIDTDDADMWLLGSASKDKSGTTHDISSTEGKKLVEQLLSYDKSKDDQNVLKVRPPANKDLGYITHFDPTKGDEGVWFVLQDGFLTAEDPMEYFLFQEKGLIRFEDILYDTDYTGYTVEALDPKYEGMFEIGKHHMGNYGILYSVLPDPRVMKEQFDADFYTNYPITTKVRLSKGGKSVDITITMTYEWGIVGWPTEQEIDDDDWLK